MVDILCLDRFPVSSRDTRFRDLYGGRFWEASTLRCRLAIREGSATRRQSSKRRVGAELRATHTFVSNESGPGQKVMVQSTRLVQVNSAYSRSVSQRSRESSRVYTYQVTVDRW